MIEQEYATILVIGNGFDLNLGLKTSYQDFISSDFFCSLLAENNQLCKYLKEQQDLNNWIDIENELKKYSNKIYMNSDRSVLKKEYKQLCESLCEYLNSLDMSSIDETSKAYNIIVRNLENFKNILVINYNYTTSVDYIKYQRSLECPIVKIHGSSKQKKIVFGVEDRASINPEDVFLKKSSCIWNETYDIGNILKKANNIIFLGYSLGETDHHYFEDFFMHLSNPYSSKKNILISYYREDGMYNILKQLDKLTIQNNQKLRTYQNFKMIDLAE